ncbi:Alpha/Beta hydrolase protein [Apiosordaria backusii]|uniref:Alpha/Beta hydrolase protein n=1 Tax=Apiosordaria backusii TaxID=314023 RepID=A0AA40BKP4_9PEZI|nr:Alpha/Beta hydrolase protein [Apiosordaria backusii]
MDADLKIPTVAETLKHPAFPTAIWNLEPNRKGLCPVAEGRGGPLNIHYEIHGEGPIKLVFIMGLGGLLTGWQRQTLHFGHHHREKYSVLVFDNRGVGSSDKPLMRYSSSEMARDLYDLVTSPAVGFLPPSPESQTRCLHIVGISLGGMIAQEFACLFPHTISSLSLCCTAPAIKNYSLTWLENIKSRIGMLMPKSPDESVAGVARQIFARGWLPLPDDADLPIVGETPKLLPPPGGRKEYGKFESNAQRFVAQEMHKRMDKSRFGLKGFLLQLVAAGWHNKSEEQLREMADGVGRERILVMHGTEDGMISLPHGEVLMSWVEPARGLVLEGMGHAPSMERTRWFNELVGEWCEVGERLDGRL